MEEELGGTFVVAVDELGLHGLWSTIKDLVESRMPLQGLTLPNKVGKPVGVPRLPLSFVLSTDKRLLHLKQYSHSPVTWFRNPATHLVLVSTADVHEYKSTTRAHIKRVTADIEKDWGGGNVGSEWLILYVRPFELEAGDKGAKKVFEKLCDDFGSKRRERVVRLDVPLRAFDSPASSSSASARHGASSRLNASGNFVGPGGTALAAGLDELCAGLRDSIRAAFEARKMAYDAEVRKLHNDRRDPGWSFTMLYLVKDSFALMLEGAGLWEDAFQEYVELEAVYLDCLEAAAQGSAHSGGVGSHTDFGVTGRDSEDIATLLSSSWRKMRSLVLQKRNVQEFQFRQYLFAAQARVLLKLNRPVDVAERGLVFVQNFLPLLAAKEAAGQVKPWFKECWVFSACVSLITAVTSFMQRCHDLPTDWEVHDVLQQPAGPSSTAAQAALRQLAAAGGEGTAGDRSRHVSSSPTPGSTAATAPLPVLPASAWQLGAVESETAGIEGSGAGSSSGTGAAGQEDDVPPLDLALLCGRAILPGNLALLLQEGEPRRELMDKLYCCLMGHLYHLARGELLRLGSALQLAEAAAANTSVLALNKAAFSPPKPAAAAAAPAAAASADSSRSPRGSPVKQQQQQQQQQPRSLAANHAAAGGQQQGGGSRGSSSSLSAAVGLLLQASAAGSLSPRMVTQLQELLMTPLCGFSMMINKYADGSSNGLTYEVHTPRLDQDPLAAALHRVDSQSTPYLSNATTAAGAATNSPRLSAPAANSPFGRSGSAATAAPAASPAAGGGSSSMFDRLRRVGSSSGSIASGGSTPTAAAAGGSGAQVQQQQQQQQPPGQQQSSRLSKVTGDLDTESSGPPAAAQDVGSSSMRRQDSSTSLSTVNIGGRSSGDGAASFSFPGQSGAPTSAAAAAAADAGADDVIEDISLSGASMTAAAGHRASTGDAGSVTDSASSFAAAGGAGQAGLRPSHIRTQSAAEGPAASTVATSADGPSLRVATHTRSASALPATSSSEQHAAAGAAAAGEGSASKQDAPAAVDKGLRSRRQAAPAALQSSPATAAAAAAVPGWVGEWRLRLALRSPTCFQELVLALSQRAAWCYAKAGRVRSSALLCADVAVLALQRGQLDTAASLLDRMHQIFASEGWQQLLGVLLPKLLACQSLAAQPMLPFTALRLLALQPGAAAAADRQAAFEELLTAVGASPAAAVAAAAAAAAAGARAVVAAVPGAGGLSGSSKVQLATLSAIQLRPAPGTYSHFFGNEAPEVCPSSTSSSSSSEASDGVQQLVPVLSPPARPVAAVADSSSSSSSEGRKQRRRQGAALLVVGDSLPLAVDVVSRLPAPVLLQRPVLSLVQLHKSCWVSSTTSTVSTVGCLLTQPDLSSGAGRSPGKGARGSSAQGLTQGKGYSAVWNAISAADRVFGGQTDSPREQPARWQEGEELVAAKLLAAFSPPGSSGSNSSSSGGGCGGSSGSAGGKVQEAGQGCCLMADGSVLLAPGVNRLVFRVAPVQSGLYCLKQLRALLGVCGELTIGLPPPGSLSLLAAAASLGSSRAAGSSSGSSGAAAVTCDPAELPAVAGGAGGSDVVQMGGVTSTGAVVSEVVVARVVAPAPRVRLEPLVPEGSLPVGGSAWLGLLVTPLQCHTLTNPRLHLQPSRHLAIVAAAVTPGGAGSLLQQQQQPVAGVGLEATGSNGSRSSEQQQQSLLGGVSASALTITSTSSSSIGAHVQQQHLGQYVYAVPLQKQQQQQAGSTQDSGVADAAGQMGHAGKWLPLRRGCVDLTDLLLPSGVLSGPLLVWMQVLVGSPPSPHAIISVASLPPAAPSQAAAAAALTTKVVPEPCVLLAGRMQEAAADMLLQLEYTADAGVWRSHASSLQLPLQQPVHLTATALQLPSGAVALSITLSLDPALKTAFILHQAGLRPQFGLILGPGFSTNGKGSGGSNGSEGLGGSRAGFSDAVPLVLVPGGTAGLSFLLLPDSGDKLTGSFEADGCNLLLLSYSLTPYGAAAGAVHPTTRQLLPLPPGTNMGQDSPEASATAGTTAAASRQGGSEQVAAAAAAGVLAPLGGSSSSSGAVLTLQLPFWLEFPSLDDSSPAAASLRVTLLGPYVGRVGQPVTLSWQLARIMSADSGPDGEQAAAYSSVALGDSSHQQQELEAAAGLNGYNESSNISSRQMGAADGTLGQQGSSAVEADELLCYELVFGQQAQSKPEGVGSDGSGGRAAPSTAASSAAAAAAADMGGVSSSANAALLWGVSGAPPSGVVRLGRAPGSLAVVEVVLLPRTVGRLGAPQLVLKSPGGNQLVLVEGSSGHNPSLTISR